MTLHKAGYKIIAFSLIVSALLVILLHRFTGFTIFHGIFYFLLFVLDVLIVAFFRLPKRNFKLDEKAVLCPADGKVVIIEQVFEPEYLKRDVIQISVFMSPLNVHVNRSPVSGIVSFFKYHKGKYLVAWHPKSSLLNERTTIVLKTENGTEILVRQIAGAVARRIEYYVKEGLHFNQADELGFIKFGSRVDVFVPIGTKINVKTDEVVKGGMTHLAYLE